MNAEAAVAGPGELELLRVYPDRAKVKAKVKKIKEESEKIKEMSGKHQTIFSLSPSLSLGLGTP